MLRLRMVAVKNSMKRSAGAFARARIMAGSASSPARTSAGGGTISSVKTIGCLLATLESPPRPLRLYST